MATAAWAFVASRASARAAGTIGGSARCSATSGSASPPETALRPVVGARPIAFFRVGSRRVKKLLLLLMLIGALGAFLYLPRSAVAVAARNAATLAGFNTPVDESHAGL